MKPNPARYLLDRGGKVVVSLGGARCPVGCAHCYVFAPGFRFFPKRSPEEVVDDLCSLGPDLRVVYLPGDIEPFLDPDGALEFLEMASRRLDVDLLFTTRLVLANEVVNRVALVAAAQRRKGRLLIGCVSIPAWDSYGRIEKERIVPTPAARVEQLRQFAAIPIPTMLAVRPVFPRQLVAPDEYRRLITNASTPSTVILSEALFLDTAGVLERRLRLTPDDPFEIERMSFFDQDCEWKVFRLEDQVAVLREACRLVDKPFYVRSVPGVDLIRRFWDSSTATLALSPVYPLPVPDFDDFSGSSRSSRE